MSENHFSKTKKIYLLTQNEKYGYDTYDSMVVIAENEEEARNIHPSGDWRFNGCWASSPKTVKVEFLGNAKKDSKNGIVMTSFNAG